MRATTMTAPLTIRCAAVVVHAALSCQPWCGLDCRGYGAVPCTSGANQTCCGTCIVRSAPTPPPIHTFLTFTAMTLHRGGCVDGQCLACPGNSTVSVGSNHDVFLSSLCTYYNPSNDANATIALEPDARNVRVFGPGHVFSGVWPLAPGMPFTLAAFPVLEHSGNGSTETALHISRSGLLEVEAHAPDFETLVSVASANGRQLTLDPASFVVGSAATTVAGMAHVAGGVDVECVGTNQHVVLQETWAQTLAFNITCKQCEFVNLTELLGAYGVVYDRVYFDEKVPNHHLKLVEAVEHMAYLTGACILLYIVVLRGYWVEKHSFKTD